MKTDLTRGSALKQIIYFSIPFLIGNLFQQIYNVVDMIIVGRFLDVDAYAAVGSTGSLVWFTIGAIQALTTGFSVITASYFGSHYENEVKRSFGASIRLSALIAIAMTALCALLAMPMLEIMQTPEDIIEDAYSYIIFLFLGIPATMLFNLLSNMIRAIGDSRTPLYFLITACIINIFLDIFLIAICGMGTGGAGLATVIAQLLSGIMCIIYIKKKHPSLHLSAEDMRLCPAMDKKLLATGVPMAFLNMVLSVGSVVMQFVTNDMGKLYVSAQTTGAKIQSFCMQPMMAFGSALAVFTAQNYGAKKYARIIEASKKTTLISFAWNAFSFVIIFFFGRLFTRLLAGEVDPLITESAYTYIFFGSLLMFILSPLILFKSVLQAVEHNFWTTVSGFTEILARAGLAYAAMMLIDTGEVTEEVGFLGICLGNPLAWLFGLMTIIFDYIAVMRKFRRIANSEAEDNTEIRDGASE